MDKETMLIDVMAAVALFQGLLFLRFAVSASARPQEEHAFEQAQLESDRGRIARADQHRERVSPGARYVASGVGFSMAGALLAHLVSPAVAYALLCLAMAGRCLADQVVEERAPRRRSALIGRLRSIDPVLVAWVGLTGTAALTLVPWVLQQPYRVAALIAAACIGVMVVVAWRIASAPPLLFGNDLEAEQVVDRETRTLRTGNACVLTIGAAEVFNAFVGGQQGFIDHRFTVWGLQLLWVALLAWRTVYARRLTRTPLAS